MADEQQQQTIESPEDALLAAIMAPDAQDVDAPDKAKLDDPQSIDEPDEGEDERAEADEEKSEAKAKEEPAEPAEDEIEIPGEDGAEPSRVKVSEVLRKAQEYDRLEGQKAEIVERVEREAVEAATTRLKSIEQAGQQTAYMIHAAMQLLQEPQPPSTDMLNPQSDKYNPEQYHLAFAQYQRAAQQHGQARQLSQHLMQQAQAAAAQAKEQREAAELQKLQRAWPEFGQRETQEKFVSDMGREFGFSPEELDEVLVDHRQALVARDALAYRAMKAQSGQVKAKVEAKAPKLVRSKQEAKGSSAQARDTKGRYASDNALSALKQTHSDDAAAAYFAGLVKAGRI